MQPWFNLIEKVKQTHLINTLFNKPFTYYFIEILHHSGLTGKSMSLIAVTIVM